ncbi:SDR family NAD(P)-dependent oxidoreductase [Lysobacter maris]|uniref:SDR family NAD(P)-dependent oxidoreductase n=1 Tax=Marilutibacter maris TaxID=1605891 RepID=A0A508A281_9GAMM|nr:SDR family oxidoreductase [Lysobacter maris]KAB8162308.1 SDR family NAD(P)-dependent oxidoreductase [Lysobacter maris]
MKTVLITGANRGIGLALTRRFSARGDKVIAVCRNSSPELEATGAQVEAGIDVSDAAALAELAGRLGHTRVDVLVCNAGILSREVFGDIDGDGFEAMRRQFEINTLGPLRTVQVLAGVLGEGSRVGIITSRMGSMADNGSGGYYGYRASKAAVNAIGRSLAIDLKPRGIDVFLLHPGFVSTDMVDNAGEISPDESAAQLVERLDTLSDADSGSFWHANGTPLPW